MWLASIVDHSRQFVCLGCWQQAVAVVAYSLMRTTFITGRSSKLVSWIRSNEKRQEEGTGTRLTLPWNRDYMIINLIDIWRGYFFLSVRIAYTISLSSKGASIQDCQLCELIWSYACSCNNENWPECRQDSGHRSLITSSCRKICGFQFVDQYCLSNRSLFYFCMLWRIFKFLKLEFWNWIAHINFPILVSYFLLKFYYKQLTFLYSMYLLYMGIIYKYQEHSYKFWLSQSLLFHHGVDWCFLLCDREVGGLSPLERTEEISDLILSLLIDSYASVKVWEEREFAGKVKFSNLATIALSCASLSLI